MQLTRFRPVRGVLRTVSTDSIVLLQLRRKRWHLENNQPDLWSEVGWLRRNFYLPWQRTPRALPTAMLKPRLRGAARRAHGSSAEHAMRDLIASHAPLRTRRHKARQNGPKHYPRGFKGIAIPLARLSPLSFVVQRKMGPPEVVGLVERPVKSYSERHRPRRSPVKHRGRKNEQNPKIGKTKPPFREALPLFCSCQPWRPQVTAAVRRVVGGLRNVDAAIKRHRLGDGKRCPVALFPHVILGLADRRGVR